MAFDVFLSYSTDDKPTADATCSTLEAAGIRCWMAPRDIRPGHEWGSAIVEAIDACRVMVLIFSKSADASRQVHREIERAVSKGVTIVPMRIQDIVPTQSMEYFLGSIHWLDALTPPLAQHLAKLAITVRANLDVHQDVSSTVRRQSEEVKSNQVDQQLIPPSYYRSVFRNKFIWIAVCCLAIGLVGAVGLAIWQGTDILQRLAGKKDPTEIFNEQLLTQILRSASDQPLNLSPLVSKDTYYSITSRAIRLDKLYDSIFQNDDPPEIIFWLFINTIQVTSQDGIASLNYNPPNDYGCIKDDPLHRLRSSDNSCSARVTRQGIVLEAPNVPRLIGCKTSGSRTSDPEYDGSTRHLAGGSSSMVQKASIATGPRTIMATQNSPAMGNHG